MESIPKVSQVVPADKPYRRVGLRPSSFVPTQEQRESARVRFAEETYVHDVSDIEYELEPIFSQLGWESYSDDDDGDSNEEWGHQPSLPVVGPIVVSFPSPTKDVLRAHPDDPSSRRSSRGPPPRKDSKRVIRDSMFLSKKQFSHTKVREDSNGPPLIHPSMANGFSPGGYMDPVTFGHAMMPSSATAWHPANMNAPVTGHSGMAEMRPQNGYFPDTNGIAYSGSHLENANLVAFSSGRAEYPMAPHSGAIVGFSKTNVEALLNAEANPSKVHVESDRAEVEAQLRTMTPMELAALELELQHRLSRKS
jgi:hypothetical protein